MDMSELLQDLSWLAAFITLLVTLWRINYDRTKDRAQRNVELKQRRQSLKWDQARAAKSIVDEMLASDLATMARHMLDYPSGRVYVIAGERLQVDRAYYLEALERRLNGPDDRFTSQEIHVRDCFDSLFFYLGIMEHWVRSELVRFEDVKYPVDYYVRLLKAPVGDDRNGSKSSLGRTPWEVYERYMQDYGMDLGLAFCAREPG